MSKISQTKVKVSVIVDLDEMWGCKRLIPFFRCSKIVGEAHKQEILQQMFRKF